VKFYLGSHIPGWLTKTEVPLFVAAPRIRARHKRTFPRAIGRWALDSGGFSEISKFGHWRTDAKTYARETRLWRDEIGGLDWAAIQDWMCEDFILKKTGKTTEEHQRLTIQSYEDLLSLAPDLPWVPVLQGFLRDDYLRHLDAYLERGHNLFALPTVGVGSVCRRQGMKEATDIISILSRFGLKIHAFGFKVQGLWECSDMIVSSDSMAWSFNARRNPYQTELKTGCVHRSCANCLKYALAWRQKLMDMLTYKELLKNAKVA
jgi:hypothetical protein